LSFFFWLAGRDAAAAPASQGKAASAAGEEMVVVAMRYLIKEGTSHAHLYLYGRDGKLIRQLTKAEVGQDADPVFSPDGKSVLYGRTEGERNEWRLVSIDGKSDRVVKTPPSWQEAQSHPASLFGVPEAGTETPAITAKAGKIPFPMKDGKGALTLKDDPARREPGDPEWFPKMGWFRGGSEEAEVSIAAFPVLRPQRAQGEKLFWTGPLPAGVVPSELGVEPQPESPEVLPESVLLTRNSPFLECAPLSVAFFSQHLGSTDGSRLMAADLRTRKLFDLTPNGGALVILEGRPEFACVCNQRYLPLGDGRTVNCSYLDLWDSREEGLRRTRFAEAGTGKFYGASIRVVGKGGAVVFHIPSSL